MKIALGGALYAISGNINSVEEAARYAESLYCTVLYCTVLYCTVLYCTVQVRGVPGGGCPPV